MKRDQYWSRPKNATKAVGCEAWWYADKGSISIHISITGGGVVCAKINRRQLAEYIKRSAK